MQASGVGCGPGTGWGWRAAWASGVWDEACEAQWHFSLLWFRLHSLGEDVSSAHGGSTELFLTAASVVSEDEAEGAALRSELGSVSGFSLEDSAGKDGQGGLPV